MNNDRSYSRAKTCVRRERRAVSTRSLCGCVYNTTRQKNPTPDAIIIRPCRGSMFTNFRPFFRQPLFAPSLLRYSRAFRPFPSVLPPSLPFCTSSLSHLAVVRRTPLITLVRLPRGSVSDDRPRLRRRRRRHTALPPKRSASLIMLSAKCQRWNRAIYQRGGYFWSIYPSDSDLHQLIFVKPRRFLQVTATVPYYYYYCYYTLVSPSTAVIPNETLRINT